MYRWCAYYSNGKLIFPPRVLHFSAIHILTAYVPACEVFYHCILQSFHSIYCTLVVYVCCPLSTPATPSAVQPTPSPTNSVKTGGNETNRRSGLPVWAIGAIVGVVLFFAIIVAVACTYCCYKYKWCADVENGKRGGRSSPIDESSVSPDDGTATINNGCNSVSYKKDQ